MKLAPCCKGKSVETERVMFTFSLTGRDVIGCGGSPRVSLRLPWAKEAIGLSARLGCQGYALPLTFQPAWSIPLFVRAMRHGNNASVQIGGICGSKNQALNALEKTSGRKRPRIANAMRGVFIKEHESPMRAAP